MKHCLVYLNGPNPGATVDLSGPQNSWSIGRDQSCAIPLDDHEASRHHASISKQDGQWRIEDAGSRNGTMLNAHPIDRSTLEVGDLIRIGGRVLAFLEADAEAPEVSGNSGLLHATTNVIRVTQPEKQLHLLERVQADSQHRVVRNLSLLCQMSNASFSFVDGEELHRHVGEAIVSGIRCDSIKIYLAGVDGRLHCEYITGPEVVSSHQSRLLAGVTIEHNEAVLQDFKDQESDVTLQSIVAPVPGRDRPRGAIVCFSAPPVTEDVESRGRFEQDDLDLVVALANQYGLCLEGLEHRAQLKQANAALRQRLQDQDHIVGSSPQIRTLLDQVGRAAPASSTVLVLGESGTGKELIASTIHEQSSRANGPFICINCAAVSESLLESELFGHEVGAFTGASKRRIGQFERAHRGTLFLDEVGEMSPTCQAKLLRVLEGHPFTRLGGTEPIRADVRIIAATNRDLQHMVNEKEFREDLYFRLRVIELLLPPLREREGDALELAVHFLRDRRRREGKGPRRLSKEAAAAISSYPWPGNVRELENAIARAAMADGDEVLVEDLQLRHDSPHALSSLNEAEIRHIRRVLKAVGGNKTLACKILEIGRATLYKKLSDVEED